MEYDKKNGDVAFRESDHTYFKLSDPTLKFISVTTLIHSFAQEFDKDFWSAYKALQKLIPSDQWNREKKSFLARKKFDPTILDMYNIDINDFNREQQNILDEWDENNRLACERGTKIHLDLENSFYDSGKNVNLSKFGIGGKFECRKDYSDLDLEYGVYPEYLIHAETSDGILKLAGQVDLIVKSGNEITVCDWKTNREIKTKSGYNATTNSSVKMKYPLNNLDDVNFYHYTMQLSTYAWMLQRINPEFIIKDLILCHFDHNDKQTIYHCDYLKTEVERMLIYYKKLLIKEQQQSRRKRIEY